MKLDLDFEELFPHPVEDVWDAITDASSISDWLMATDDFRAELGARFRLKTEHLSPSGWIDAQVVEIDPPHRMAWSWSADPAFAPTLVIFELSADADGTRLRLTHAGEIDPVVGSLLTEGWPTRFDLLRRSLD